jgi:molecular chaperone DnaJ
LRGVKKTINISTNEICTQCHGSGCKGSYQKKNCSKCNGKGRVVVRQSPAVGVIFTSEKICDACGGQGNYIDPQNKCTDCSDGLKIINKHIMIDIPPRTVFGSVLRIIQQGSLRKPHGKRGDCFIQIVPENHELFKIATKTEDDELVQNHEFNLLLEIPITLSQAIKGCNLKVPLLDRVYDIEIPALVDAKFSKKIIGAGLYQNHGGRCDIIIKIVIEINKNINSLGFAEILEKNEGEESNPKSFDMQRKMKQQERMQNG